MSGFCPHEWHQTTEADLQQMAAGDDYWMFADAAGSGGFRPWQLTRAERAENKRQYAIQDVAIAQAKSEGLTFHLLPIGEQCQRMGAAEAAIANASASKGDAA